MVVGVEGEWMAMVRARACACAWRDGGRREGTEEEEVCEGKKQRPKTPGEGGSGAKIF